MVITFFYTIGLFSFAVTFHALLLRILGQNQFMLWGLIYGFAILALINTLPVPELSYPFFSLNFILLWLMYLYFLGSLTRSISIHMISQIVEHGPSKFDREDILELYHEDQSSLVRFEAMAKNGFIKIKNGETLEITKKGRILCLAFLFIRKVFLTEKVG